MSTVGAARASLLLSRWPCGKVAPCGVAGNARRVDEARIAEAVAGRARVAAVQATRRDWRNGVGSPVDPYRPGDTMSTRTIAIVALAIVVVVVVVLFVI